MEFLFLALVAMISALMWVYAIAASGQKVAMVANALVTNSGKTVSNGFASYVDLKITEMTFVARATGNPSTSPPMVLSYYPKIKNLVQLVDNDTDLGLIPEDKLSATNVMYAYHVDWDAPEFLIAIFGTAQDWAAITILEDRLHKKGEDLNLVTIISDITETVTTFSVRNILSMAGDVVCWKHNERGFLSRHAGMKLLLGSHTEISTVEKSTIMPPCDGYYTDFTWQISIENQTSPTVVIFGDFDPTNDIMPESSGDEAQFAIGNVEIFVMTAGNNPAGSTVQQVHIRHSKKKIHAKAGKPLTYAVHGNSASKVLVIMSAQFVPTNGATIILERRVNTEDVADSGSFEDFRYRVPHDMWLKEIDVGLSVEAGAETWNGVAKLSLIRNQNELVSPPTMAASGDVYQFAPQDETIGSFSGMLLAQKNMDVNTNEVKSFQLEKGKEDGLNTKLMAGDVLLLTIIDQRGLDFVNVSINARYVGTIRNGRRRKRHVFIDGNRHTNWPRGSLLGGAPFA